ncbi:interleukin-27 subunit beta [Genypterus blacodes]|uniref:interleukin-27 subunit beta n=1 Tax=Genypterus blacodes TaxID=154954 RepID=UPI003F7722E2
MSPSSLVWVTSALLMCALGSDTLNLLKANMVTGNAPSTPAVHCWCAGYPNQTLCSWPETSHSPPEQYIATYSERHRHWVTEQCHLIPPGSSSSGLISASASSSEQLWHCHLQDLKLLTDYIINITAVYPAGSSSHLTSFMMEEIVKPDPPVNVRVFPDHFRNLTVEWSPPATWSNLDIFPLKYHIQYKWEIRGTPKSVPLGPFESTRVDLRGLSPGRTYLFQVCAMELLGLGECSNWSSPVETIMPKAKWGQMH